MDRLTARNSAGYDAPVGLAADPVVFTLVDGDLSVLLAQTGQSDLAKSMNLPEPANTGLSSVVGQASSATAEHVRGSVSCVFTGRISPSQPT